MSEIVDDPKVPGIISLSLYDTKPLFLITTEAEKYDLLIRIEKYMTRNYMRWYSLHFTD